MIVLTGGAGFIGSCMLRKLNDEGIDDVLVVDELKSGNKWKNLVGKRFTDILHKDDFRFRLLSGEYDGGIEGIFHFGACSSTTETDADYLLDNNYAYSRDLAEFAAAQDVRLIYASSAATYGDGSKGYSDTEFDSLCPLNMYGYSKHIFDQWVRRKGYDKRFVGLKFFNVFGPNEYHKNDMASLVFKACRQIEQSGTVELFKSYRDDYADGEQKRDFIYVADAVNAVWGFWLDPRTAGIYNIGTGRARSWNDLVNATFMALQRPASIRYIDMPPNLRDQYQYFTQAEVGRLRSALPQLHFHTLEDAVADYVNEYLHPTRRTH